jgi:hypothetical protein
MRRVRRVVVLGSLAFVVGCTRPLPDADSPGAQLYQARCGGSCHALYEPRTLTAAMWEVQVERMRETLRRAGVSLLTEEEEGLMLSYLRAHATDAGVQP